MKNSEGFSLIEVLIAIVVIGIIAAVAGLNLHAYTLNRNLKSAAREIASDFTLCKQKAASESNTYQIVFNVAGSSYTIQTITGVPPAVTKNVSSFGKDITINSETFGGTVNFNARGTIQPAGNIVLRNSRNSTATVTVTTMGKANVTFNIQ